MQSSRHYSKIMICAAAVMLGASSVSCGLLKKESEDLSEYPTRQTRTPGAVWRNGDNHNRDWARTKPNDDDYYDDRGIDDPSANATDAQWKLLDIKLGRHDNKALYNEVKTWLGTPYRGGGHTKQVGADCSGFVMEVYLSVYNIALERRGSLQYSKNCTPIDKSELREGDLVFFHGGSGDRITHVGLYLKNNKFVHASSSRGVIVSDLTQKYYVEHYYGAGRVSIR